MIVRGDVWVPVRKTAGRPQCDRGCNSWHSCHNCRSPPQFLPCACSVVLYLDKKRDRALAVFFNSVVRFAVDIRHFQVAPSYYTTHVLGGFVVVTGVALAQSLAKGRGHYVVCWASLFGLIGVQGDTRRDAARTGAAIPDSLG